MLKLQCKTTFNSVFLVKKNHQNRTSRLWNNALKMWFYMKYIVKNYSDRILLARLCISQRRQFSLKNKSVVTFP